MMHEGLKLRKRSSGSDLPSFSSSSNGQIGNSNFYSKTSKSKGNSFPLLVSILVLLASLLSSTVFFSKYRSALKEAKRLTYELDQLMNSEKEISKQVNREHAEGDQADRDLIQVEIDLSRKKLTLIDLKEHSTHLEDSMTNVAEEVGQEWKKVIGEARSNETMKCFKKEEQFRNRAALLRSRIARENRRETIEAFGPGPHKVLFTLILPNLPNERFEFIMEMAPIDLMPHTVHTFLQQVHHKLWDGCTFVFCAEHILQASPMPSDLNPHADLRQPFYENSLDKVYFQEYSQEYPHVTNTVGISGRPGGPDFYINLVDNTDNHGPGGQIDNILKEEADPCFGKIISGLDVIEKMKNLPTTDYEFDKFVHIESARIMGSSLKAEDYLKGNPTF
eukprot:CAMPEP_0194421814 /NCGR_PEP_ID=MMETSP0176-20130528/21073_1 /TAXON_ID=216777 /ORGANISM="Proboscia alata, Strain PI-D3" /LENGTH=390 /DNA_ID=CAMNT_0039230155 /DNA_START=19 /DNA_END=1191 /DNA_ORIENTATION=-